jgi:hypothetical protein
MSPNLPRPTAARSAEVVNRLIRALWQRTGRVLTVEQRREYEGLVVEWAQADQAERRDVVKAA